MLNLKIITQILHESGKTKRWLAKEIGLTEVGLHQLIQRNTTSRATLEKIAAALKISPDTFYMSSDQVNDAGVPYLTKMPCPDCEQHKKIIANQLELIDRLNAEIKKLKSDKTDKK